MKSMILKDLYNISHNARQMLFLCLFLTVCLIPSGGVAPLPVEFGVLFGMMTITTFSFDEKTKWEKYAMVMPVSRKEYVLAKYGNSVLYGIVGAGSGLALGLLIGLFMGKLDAMMLVTILSCSAVGILFSLFLGSVMIPLVIRFGTEHARMIMLGSVAVPSLLVFLVYKSAPVLGSDAVWILSMAGVALVIAWLIVSPILSVKWFEKKEF